jgi:hypothetical protein
VALGDDAEELLLIIACRFPVLEPHPGQQIPVSRLGRHIKLGALPEVARGNPKRPERRPATDYQRAVIRIDDWESRVRSAYSSTA